MDEAQPLFDSPYTGLQIEEAIAAGLELQSDPQLALANLGGRPNRNLWDNWYFVGGGSQSGYGNFPINQKGKQLYDQADGNCIDRHYKSSGAVVELLGDCLKVTLKRDGAPNRFAHIFSANLISGTTYTLSLLVKSASNKVNVFVQENGGEFTTPVTGEISSSGIFSATFKCTKTAMYQAILSNKSGLETELELIACGMHVGSIQLLAYNESDQWNVFETPDYGETLARCQQYGLFSGENALYAVPLSIGQAFLPTPVTMRAKPVIVGTPVVYNADTNSEATGAMVSVLNVTQNGVLLQLSGASAPTRGYVLFPAGTGLSAEL